MHGSIGRLIGPWHQRQRCHAALSSAGMAAARLGREGRPPVGQYRGAGQIQQRRAPPGGGHLGALCQQGAAQLNSLACSVFIFTCTAAVESSPCTSKRGAGMLRFLKVHTSASKMLQCNTCVLRMHPNSDGWQLALECHNVISEVVRQVFAGSSFCSAHTRLCCRCTSLRTRRSWC